MGFCVQLVHSGRIGQYPSLIDSHAFNKSQNKNRAESCIWRFGCVPVILPNPESGSVAPPGKVIPKGFLDDPDHKQRERLWLRFRSLPWEIIPSGGRQVLETLDFEGKYPSDKSGRRFQHASLRSHPMPPSDNRIKP